MGENRETVHHPIFARFYERFVAAREGEEIRARRERLLARRTPRSTPWWSRSSSAAFRISGLFSRSFIGFCGPVASCASSST